MESSWATGMGGGGQQAAGAGMVGGGGGPRQAAASASRSRPTRARQACLHFGGHPAAALERRCAGERDRGLGLRQQASSSARKQHGRRLGHG